MLPPVWQNAVRIMYCDTSKALVLPQVCQAAAAQCRHAAESCMMQQVLRGMEKCCWELNAALLPIRCCKAAGTQALQIGVCS